MRTPDYVIIVRTITDIFIIVCLFTAPFWLTALCAILALVIFPRYYEIIVFAVLADATYLPAFSHFVFGYVTLVSVVLYIIQAVIRPHVRAR